MLQNTLRVLKYFKNFGDIYGTMISQLDPKIQYKININMSNLYMFKLPDNLNAQLSTCDVVENIVSYNEVLTLAF